MPGVNFGEVKKMVGMQDLLARYNVEVRCCNPATQQFKGRCPLPTHKSDKETFSVNFDRDCWKCWAPSCSQGGVLDFVKEMEGCSLLEAAKKIVQWFGEKQNPPQRTEGFAESQPDVKTENSTVILKPQLVKRDEPRKRRPVWAEKSRAENISDAAGAGRQPVPPDTTALAAPVKAEKPRFMQEVDIWFDNLVKRGENETDEKYWLRIRTGVKSKLIENYRSLRKEMARTA